MSRALFFLAMAAVMTALSNASCADGSRPLPARDLKNMPSLEGATGWINSDPLDAKALRGRVVLVDFWTYTCINWRRTAPYLRLWARKYKDAGLVIVGVHSPEFGFERDPERVRKFTAATNIEFPVAIDSRHAVWRAFDNQYWPALYFVDAKGKIRQRLFGESDYDKAETVLQGLLKEAGALGVDTTMAPVVGKGAEAAADWANLKTPETYTGFTRTERFASPGGVVPSRGHNYVAPPRLPDNQWALVGNWTITQESARSNVADARVLYRFHARDLHLVMGAPAGSPVRIRLRIDGKAPGSAHGSDVDSNGAGTVSEYRMYQLIRQTAPIEYREAEILILDPGIELFSFTFG